MRLITLKFSHLISLVVKLILVSLFLYLPLLVAQLFFTKIANEKTFLVFYFSLSSIFVAIIIISYAARQNKLERYNITTEFKQLPFLFLPIVILGTLALFFVIDPLEQIFPISSTRQNYLAELMQLKAYSFLVIVLVMPILEEILFRGIILKSLLNKFNPLVAIVLSALFFGAMHFSLAQLITGLIGGTFLGYLFWQTKSLSTCIIVHITYNAFSFFSYHLVRTDFSIESAIANTTVYLSLYLLAAFALAFSILFIYQKSQAKRVNSGNF